MQMKAEGLSRRDLLGVAGAAVVAVPALANADTEYPNVPFLGGSDQVRAAACTLMLHLYYRSQSPQALVGAVCYSAHKQMLRDRGAMFLARKRL